MYYYLTHQAWRRRMDTVDLLIGDAQKLEWIESIVQLKKNCIGSFIPSGSICVLWSPPLLLPRIGSNGVLL